MEDDFVGIKPANIPAFDKCINFRTQLQHTLSIKYMPMSVSHRVTFFSTLLLESVDQHIISFWNQAVSVNNL